MIELSLFFVVKSMFFGALAALGFAILFNVPKKALLGCASIGAVGIISRLIFQYFGIGIEIATLFSAMIVGLCALGMYHFTRIPAVVYSVSAAIPMIPGVYAFKAMIGVISIASMPGDMQMIIEIWTNFIKTALILFAIATGITAPSLIFKRFRMVI